MIPLRKFLVFLLLLSLVFSFAAALPQVDEVLLPGSHKIVPPANQDYVYFKITPEDFSIVSFSLKGSAPDYVPQITLYDEDEKFVKKVTGVEGGEASLDYVVGKNRVYFVEVNVFKPEINELVLSYDVSSQNDAGLGVDAPSDFRKALLISANKDYQGSFRDEDSIDSYKVDLRAGEEVVVTVRSDDYIRLDLINGKLNTFFSQQEHRGLPLSTRYKALDDESLIIVLRGDSDYSLRVDSDYRSETVVSENKPSTDNVNVSVPVIDNSEESVVNHSVTDEVVSDVEDSLSKVSDDISNDESGDDKNSSLVVVLLVVIALIIIYFFIKQLGLQVKALESRPKRSSRRKKR